MDEEKKLISVLKEYKERFKEYEKSTKLSKQSHKRYEKELKALD